ncbi:hypothetical protein OCU04_005524 [Sclerotinia nivalis]|uniref:Uncharacterized protein n=1 Tax=Sclerotinia nivalis TaxID=352851 RepID=A0A9X0APB2_9HELO|nr:hypothetical protein OCU04_005524 [Sclerotinia nivalis]
MIPGPTAHHKSSLLAYRSAATVTKLLPADLAAPIISAGTPVSTAHHVWLAVVYSATASQSRQVEGYGRDTLDEVNRPGRWNGRIILTLGDKWTELEEPIASLRESWFGAENSKLTAFYLCFSFSFDGARLWRGRGLVRVEETEQLERVRSAGVQCADSQELDG